MPRIDGKLMGVEEPRIFTPPLRELTPDTSLGFEAIDFAEKILGWSLYPWQRWFLTHALEVLEDGRPRFRTIVLMVARQNGKTAIVQILTLWKMYVQGAVLTLGTAQKLDDAEEVWREVLSTVESNPLLEAELKQVVKKNGATEFNLVGGERYKVAAANRKGGRGKSVDGFVVIDELREQTSWDAWSALTKTIMAKKSGQVIAMSNAGDAGSVVLRRLRDRNVAAIENGTSKSVGHFEYSAPDDCAIDDREAWAQANPSCGWSDSLDEAAIEAAMESDPEELFRIEVLCQWWQGASSSQFPDGVWLSKQDVGSEIADDSLLVLSVDATQSMSAHKRDSQAGSVSIAAGGRRADGDLHGEVVAARAGLDWVFDEVVALWEANRPDALVVQGRGAVASRWVDDFRQAGINVVELVGPEVAKAHGQFYQLVMAGPDAPERFWHIGQENLTFAANEAGITPLGGAWAFDRRNPVADIDPLIAVLQAVWGVKFLETRVSGRRSAYSDSDLVVI